MEYFGRASVCEKQAEQERREYERRGEQSGCGGLKRAATSRVSIEEDARVRDCCDGREKRERGGPCCEIAAGFCE